MELIMDNEFWSSFCVGTLDAARFNHRAHLQAGFICAEKYGEEAPEKFCQLLKRFTVLKGAEEKFHYTLSYFAVKIILDRKLENENFESFIGNNQDLLLEFKEVINSYYSQDILEKPQSKKSYFQPDKLPPNK